MNVKHEFKVDEVELDNNFNEIAWKGHRVKVIEISEFDRKWSNHQYSKETLMTIHESEWKSIDADKDFYCGG